MNTKISLLNTASPWLQSEIELVESILDDCDLKPSELLQFMEENRKEATLFDCDLLAEAVKLVCYKAGVPILSNQFTVDYDFDNGGKKYIQWKISRQKLEETLNFTVYFEEDAPEYKNFCWLWLWNYKKPVDHKVIN